MIDPWSTISSCAEYNLLSFALSVYISAYEVKKNLNCKCDWKIHKQFNEKIFKNNTFLVCLCCYTSETWDLSWSIFQNWFNFETTQNSIITLVLQKLNTWDNRNYKGFFFSFKYMWLACIVEKLELTDRSMQTLRSSRV